MHKAIISSLAPTLPPKKPHSIAVTAKQPDCSDLSLIHQNSPARSAPAPRRQMTAMRYSRPTFHDAMKIRHYRPNSPFIYPSATPCHGISMCNQVENLLQHLSDQSLHQGQRGNANCNCSFKPCLHWHFFLKFPTNALL